MQLLSSTIIILLYVRASKIFCSITCVKYLIQFGDKLAPNGTLFDNINTPPHGRMNYKDTKPYMSAFLSVDLLTDFAAFCLKVHTHEIFFLTFFAETETKWSQGPVTRDFWKSYSIRPRYSTFKHFRACSAWDEIGSTYAQHAMKFVPRMLSVR